jgi:DNA replicative helicase MCM subunit Mcm2 (Cdc46/Mcm family)
LNIPPPLLSRFDLVFILRDDALEASDSLISGNIMKMYSSNHDNRHSQESQHQQPTNGVQFHIKGRLPWVAQTQNPLPADLLRDYISYAKKYCKPKLTQEAAAIFIKTYFLTLR